MGHYPAYPAISSNSLQVWNAAHVPFFGFVISMRPTLTEQNAALAEIRQQSGNLARRLSCLDLDTEWNLDIAGLPTDSLTELVDQLEFVTHAAEQALHWGKQKRGPRHDPYIDRIMPELAELYEQGTGKSFTNNPKQKKAFTWASRNRPRAATSCRFSKPSIHR